MNSELLNTYFNSFTTCLSSRLKPGWGIKMTIYPFSTGAVIVVTLKKGFANSLEKRQDSKNLGEALMKTSLFTPKKVVPVADKTIGKTVVGIYSITQYVLLKNDQELSWDMSSAQVDVDNIIQKMKEIYGK